MNVIPDEWQPWLAFVMLVVDIAASLHAVLRKRDTRAAIGWVGLIWLAPGVGDLLYGLFGLNRIRRQATEMQRARRVVSRGAEHHAPESYSVRARPRLAGLAQLTERLS